MAFKLFSRKNKHSTNTSQIIGGFDIKLLDTKCRDKFINDSKNFIYSTTYNLCKRNLSWKNDDELSIALIAFNNACDSYKQEKGNFYSFAKVIIRNSLIDFFRKSKNTPYLIYEDENKSHDYIDSKNSLNQYELQSENKERSEEILLFTKELEKFKIDFNSLVKSAPSHKDTREKLLNIAFLCIKEQSIIDYVKTKQKLPVKEIMLRTNSNRKFIERWRIYIIVLILILSNKEYVYIKSYLNIKVGDKND